MPIAVSIQRDGLLPASQHALRFYGQLAWHDYEGLAFTPAEGARLTASLGDQPAMLLRNHGTLTTGRTIAEAYVLMATLIKACEIQLQAQAGGVPLVLPPPEVAARTAEQLYDGGAIEPLYRVRVVDQQGKEFEFCCIHCAEAWLRGAKDNPRAIFVTDEASGAEVEPGSAYFVRSMLVTNPTTRNRVHVFREEAEARKHAEHSLGQVLVGAERPFMNVRVSRPSCPRCDQEEGKKE